MYRLVLIALLAAGPALADNEMTFPAAPDGTLSFTLPSGNIGCRYIPAGGTSVYQTATGQEELHCTRVAPVYTTIVLEHHLGGQQPITGGEAPGLDAGPVLDYGHFWQRGAFTCLAARSGIVCTNGSGAGLRLSRAEVASW